MKKFLKDFNLLGFLMLGLCVVVGIGDISGAVLGANGVATEVTTQSGDGGGHVVEHGRRGALETSDVRTLVPDMPQDPVDQNLVKIRPYDTPFDTILRYMNTEKTNNFEFGWYSIGTRPVEDKILSATTTAGATPELFRGEATVSDISLYAETSTINVPTILGDDGEPLMLYVYEKDNANKKIKFTVMDKQLQESSSSYDLANAISANTTVYILSRAAGELDVTSPAVSFLPKKSTGYCQIFKTQIAESAYKKIMDQELKFDLTEVEEQALFEHRRYMEGTLLFGKGGKIWDPVKETHIYTTEGIIRYILKHQSGAKQLSSTGGNAGLVDMSKAVFTGNSGAKTRFVLGGSDAIAKISKMQGIDRQQEAVKTEVVFGITWSKIVTNFGTLNLCHHELFDEYGYGSYLLVIEPQFLKKWILTNFERQVVDAKSLTIMNGTMVIFTEACGVAVYNPDVHSLWEVV